MIYNLTRVEGHLSSTFIIKGFVLDDEKLKQGSKFGKDYTKPQKETNEINRAYRINHYFIPLTY